MEMNILNSRRRELNISVPALAIRSGVSQPTLKRILSRGMNAASFDRVCAVACALGLTVDIRPTADPVKIQEQEAKKKAERIVKMVQGSSALEAQGVGPDVRQQMLRRTVHELMAGSKRRLWAT